ncbi:gamma carbonic anhydrase family protein [Candidatus Bandiella numerosa]|jgi:carbonic anhydrase/acetyltransferase-like protein (isoleucine patch superfamily)|uniref:gamma carbonic anhydrase family protein n=1 Tax=Candidatus Bandiella numerosa TaxID=2570586 RepID=UPI00249E4FD8|nr:gamma carbonic anhydrase family protein [Candidatus Bandiella numerosa]WHA05261.1 gamma carbonic anhydrase family protein [Candidatus Bandiella numerosa]
MAVILPYKNQFPKIAKDAFIAENAVIIGDVEIDSKSSIWYNCVVRGDVNYIRIGKETNIQDGTIIHVGTNNGPTIIGDGVTIGHKALIHACTICDYSFIGMNSTIMDYAQIKSYSMVAAGALVTNSKIVEINELWAGVPAKFLRQLKKDEIEYINISKDRYVNLAKEYKC